MTEERQIVPRARPVIELNLNVDEAMVETVDLIRTVRTQLESISGTIGQGLNRTVADVGDDFSKIITHVEAISKNLADTTGQLYQPMLLLLLFLLTFSILLAILFCIIFRTRWEMRRLYRRSRGGTSSSSSSSSSSSEDEEEGEDVEDGRKKKRKKERRKRKKLWWKRAFGGRSRGEQGQRAPKEESHVRTRETERQKEPLVI